MPKVLKVNRAWLMDQLNKAKDEVENAKDKAESAERYSQEAESDADDADTKLTDLLEELESLEEEQDDAEEDAKKTKLEDAEVYECIDRLCEYVDCIDHTYKGGVGSHVRDALNIHMTAVEALFAMVEYKRPEEPDEEAETKPDDATTGTATEDTHVGA